MSESPYIVDATKENFADLVAKSQEIPVLVDFWADWCGPCKQLMPVLAKLADEYQGKFLLAKVDTEAEPELAGHFQIRSIPTVKMIKGGAIVDEFMGVQPEPQIRALLDKHCGPAPEGDDAAEDEGATLDQASQMAMAQFAQGDADGAIALITQAMAEDADNHSARITLAQMQIATGKVDEAKVTLDAVPEDARDDRYQSVAGMLDFAHIVADAPPAAELEATLQADPANSGARYQLGAMMILSNRVEDGLDHLLEIVKTDRKFEEDAGRNALINAFSMLGTDHPVTQDYRRRLARLLN